jgi:HD-GYP domain-containing protein (c-di-GMP phosphodiesterase class II)
MKRINIEHLRPGMRFSEAVYIDNDTILVQANLPLKQNEIERLKKWNIKEVLTDGDVSIDRSVSDKGVHTASEQSYRLSSREGMRMYNSWVKNLDEIFTESKTGRKVDLNQIDDLVKNLLSAIGKDQNNITQLILLPGRGLNKLSESSVKNAIISSIIGKTIKLYGFRLIQLATGALLHDIGMLKVPDEIRSKKGKLTPEELKIVRTHPMLGYNIVLRELRYPEETAAIVLNHQERWDGTGYPRGVKKEEIPTGARIVAVADAFEAMVNLRAYRNPIIGYKAMKSILSDNGRHFDPKVLRALLMCIGIYPIGSLVLLNNSCIGKVIEHHETAPVRPRLQLLIDKWGDRIKETKEIDLMSQKDLFIAKAVDPNEIERLENE